MTTVSDTSIATQVWQRYAWTRDNGHSKYIEKHDKCDSFFRGDQWDLTDLATLKEQRRPALTINKIISTVGNIMGEQIYNRAEISFRPRGDADPETANILTKLFKQISDAQQLDWKRSDMFADGIIGSRGYLDIRMDFTKNMQGNISYTNLNPKNVLVDHDAEEVDPDTWNEVFVTKWMTVDEIAVLYGKTYADQLRGRTESYYPYGYDSIDFNRDRFGDMYSVGYGGMQDTMNASRSIRVIERQHRELTSQKHLVDPATGEMRPIPDTWKPDHIANVIQQFGLKVSKKMVRRIKWTIIADNVVLHNDWSPYKHFTVVPYFPFFRHGHTIGLVENLLGSQELLNKTSSQELHIVNTTANSGWTLKTGALTNMSVEELEQKGATTGLVIELDDINNAKKITPNATPTGLDRISYKAEEHIKTISGIDDTQMGQDRADVSGKAIAEKKKNSSSNLAKPMDSLIRTDFFIARNTLDLVQEYFTEERVETIVTDHHTGNTEQMTINKVTPTGEVLNDLSVGEFDVVISSVPVRETLEDSQFDQAMAMRGQGIKIPDAFVIQSSRLMKKADLIKQMQEQANSQQAQQQQQLQLQGMQADVAKTQAETQQKTADAGLKQAKAAKEGVATQKDAATPIEAPQNDGIAQAVQARAAAHKMDLERDKLDHQKMIDSEKLKIEREKAQQTMAHEAQAHAQKMITERVARTKTPPTPGARP